MSTQFKRRSRRIVQSVMGTPWMLEEAALAQIVDFLQQRSRGTTFTREQIARRLSESSHGRGVSRATSLNFDPDDDDDLDGPIVVDGGIAILPLNGVLAPRLSWMEELSGGTSTELFAQWYQEALADARVTAILCKVDSPGGSARGNEELSDLIRGTRGQKTAIAAAQGMIASAAYYVGAAFSELYASPSTEVGSVGCYMIHGESSIADKDAGYTYTVVKAGENKAAGNSVEKLTEKTKGVLQERIDAFYDQFVAAVAENRGKTVAQIEAAFGQGKVMIAEQALAAGMIDGVMTFDQVLDDLQQKTKAAAKPVRGGSGIQKPRTDAREGEMIKQQLIKMGLIDEKATDAEVNAAVKAFFKARGQEVPKGEEAVVKGLSQEAAPPSNPGPASTGTPTQPAAAAGSATPPKTEDDEKVRAENEKRTRIAERNRIENIRTSGGLLKLSEKAIQEAIESEKSFEEIATGWRTTAREGEKPLSKIEPGRAQEDSIRTACLEAMSARVGVLTLDKMSAEAKDARHLSLLDMGKLCLAQSGARFVGDNEDIAKMMLGSGTFGEIRVGRMEGGYQRPSDFPGILSALMGKILDSAQELSEATFRLWTGEIPSVPDFKPKTIHAVGEFGELPEHEDAQPFVESATSEEAAWIQVGEYADKWSLTPRLILDDDLGALQDVAIGKQTAHDMTLERLCVNLLTGNATAQDNNPLFGTSRTNSLGATMPNDITSGAAPSTTQLTTMRKYLRKIYGVSGKFKLNQTLARLLIPEDLETLTEQLLQSNLPVVPITETTGQVFRGRVQWSVVPMLSESSTTIYYGISTSQRKAIVRTYQRGFENMRTVSYYDPNTDCRVWRFQGRFAAAVRTWRTIVRNNGA